MNLISIATTNGELLKALADRKAVQCTLVGLIAAAENEFHSYNNHNNDIDNDTLSDSDSDSSSDSDSEATLDAEVANFDIFRDIDKEEKTILEEQSSVKSAFFEQIELTFLQKVGYSPTIKGCFREIKRLNSTIDRLCTRKYVPWKVFVTFNSEHSQRYCLKKTSVGGISVLLNKSTNPDVVFHGKTLRVIEASEPDVIIYESSHVRFWYRFLSWVVSFALSGATLLGFFLVIEMLSDMNGSILVALFISVINALLPTLFKLLTLSLEVHVSAVDVQASMLLKLVIGRSINSAVLIYVATPYTDTFSQESLLQIQNILIGDAVTTPLLRWLNINELFMKHFVVPFSTQEEYNASYQGAEWNLAERYTDMLKTMFVGLFFLVPLPSGMFISAVAMMTTYIVDKYALLRLWRRIPNIGHSLGTLSNYFIAVIAFNHLVVSRVYFANW